LLALKQRCLPWLASETAAATESAAVAPYRGGMTMTVLLGASQSKPGKDTLAAIHWWLLPAQR
jgi:hypothetical protein